MLKWFRSAWFCRAQLLISLQGPWFMPHFGLLSMLSPNTRLQRTPLRVEQDRAFFSARFCYNVNAIYRGGAAKAQPVGRSFISVAVRLNVQPGSSHPSLVNQIRHSFRSHFMSPTIRPATNSQTVYRLKYRPLLLLLVLLVLALGIHALFRGSPLVLTLICVFNAGWMFACAHILRIVISPSGIAYHNSGLYTIETSWANVTGIITLEVPLVGPIQYVVLVDASGFRTRAYNSFKQWLGKPL